MGERTGNPRGRPAGAKNQRTKAVEQATAVAAETLEAVIPGAFTGDAHAFLMAVYKDPTKDMNLRIDAAKAAVRYEKPALSSVEAKIEGNLTATVRKIERHIVDPSDTNRTGVPPAPEPGAVQGRARGKR